MTDEEYAEIQEKTAQAKQMFGGDDFSKETLDMLKDEFERVSSLTPSKDPSPKAYEMAENLINELTMYQLKSGDEAEFVKAGLLVEKKSFFVKMLAKCYETDLQEAVE